MSRFANGNILSAPSLFIRQCKMNVQNFCLFVIFVSAVILGTILIGLMTLSIWRCILTQIFFWLNTENNADPYITKPPNLSSTGKCDNEPHDTLFSWFSCYFYCIKAIILITADHLQWTIYVKTRSHVYMSIKKLAQNFPALLIPH